MGAPAGTISTEAAPQPEATKPIRRDPSGWPMAPIAGEAQDWPSYNKTLTSNRFSPLNQITAANAGDLKVFAPMTPDNIRDLTTGLSRSKGALIFTTEYDIFSINPNDCSQYWRTHEDYQPATPQGVSRGAAYLDGRLFRGTQDGRVLAYDFKTGKRLWETAIADPKKGESAPAAPIAWNGLVFIGNAGGDIKGVKGRMYALDAMSGKDRLGVLSRAKKPRRYRAGAGRQIAARRFHLGDAVRLADHRRRDMDLLHARSSQRSAVYSWRQSCALTLRPARARAKIFIPARSSFSMPKPETTRPITRSFRKTGTIGMFRARLR